MINLLSDMSKFDAEKTLNPTGEKSLYNLLDVSNEDLANMVSVATTAAVDYLAMVYATSFGKSLDKTCFCINHYMNSSSQHVLHDCRLQLLLRVGGGRREWRPAKCLESCREFI